MSVWLYVCVCLCGCVQYKTQADSLSDSLQQAEVHRRELESSLETLNQQLATLKRKREEAPAHPQVDSARYTTPSPDSSKVCIEE